MKRLLFTFGFLVLNIPAVAQREVPAFGKVDKSDLEMTDCDFDKGAVALVLLSQADMHYRSEEHTSELQSHHDLVCRLLLEQKKK